MNVNVLISREYIFYFLFKLSFYHLKNFRVMIICYYYYYYFYGPTYMCIL
ncbi:MAG: hypothetical protein K6253_01485 [Candidatus Liberibacter asiaticus]|nr:hypothetical protein [Candidatus Liberibacter asiaticus]